MAPDKAVGEPRGDLGHGSDGAAVRPRAALTSLDETGVHHPTPDPALRMFHTPRMPMTLGTPRLTVRGAALGLSVALAAGCGLTALVPRQGAVGASAAQTANSTADSDVLRAPWPAQESTITEPDLHRLLDLARRDPQAWSVVRRAGEVLRLASPASLGEVITLCGNSGSRGEGGRTEEQTATTRLSLELDTVASGRLDAVTQGRVDALVREAGVIDSRVDPSRQDYVIVSRRLRPRVCLTGGRDVGEAYESLVHELAHVALREPFLERDPLPFESIDAFVADHAQLPGSEVDAFIEGCGARARLEGVSACNSHLSRVFDAQGRPTVSRPELARIILDGVGYRRGLFLNLYGNEVHQLCVDLDRRRVFVANLANHRRLQLAQLERHADDDSTRLTAVARASVERLSEEGRELEERVVRCDARLRMWNAFVASQNAP